MMRFRRLKLCTGVVGLALTATPLIAAPKTLTNNDLKYSVVVPSECRIEEGPGTIEAICAPDLDEAKAVELAKAKAFLLEVDGEAVPPDAKPYGEAEFRQELPEAVCGEPDATRVKIANVKMESAGGATVLTADAVCQEIKFLGLEERHARVRYVVTPKYRFRTMARVPASDVAKTKAAADTFFSSFKHSAE